MVGERAADIEVVLELTPLSGGGVCRTVFSNYSPQYAVLDDYQTSARHQFLDGKAASTGRPARALVWLLTPEVYPSCLWVGRGLNVLEGSRIVGRATVVRILNPVLASREAQ
jgi:hypothetical protein